LDPQYLSNLKLAPFYKAFKYLIATSSCPFQQLWQKEARPAKTSPFGGTSWFHTCCTFHPRLWV